MTALPNGNKRTREDFESDLWTLTRGKKSEPKPAPKKYVRRTDLAREFFVKHADALKSVCANVTDEATRVAHCAPAGEAFVPVAKCLLACGGRCCTKCKLILDLCEFSTAGAKSGTGQLRGECNVCKLGKGVVRRIEQKAARDEAAAAGEESTCDTCGDSKSVASFEAGRKTCIVCRNGQFKAREAAKAEADPSLVVCSGCNTAKPLADMAGLATCTVCCAKGARHDATPRRREYRDAAACTRRSPSSGFE